MTDETETIRRQMVAEINAEPGSRADLESKHGQVWTQTKCAGTSRLLDLPLRLSSCVGGRTVCGDR